MAVMTGGFRREAAVLFVDESGQLQSRNGEFGVVGGLAVPDAPEHHDALRTLAGQIRQRKFGTALSHQRLKGKLLDGPDYQLIGNAVRARWCYGYVMLPLDNGSGAQFSSMLGAIEGALELKRRDLRGDGTEDFRIDFLKTQCRRLQAEHAIYLALLFKLYHDTALWFRRNGIVPAVRVVLDEKLPRECQPFMDLFLRFSFSSVFPEVYAGRLGAVLGVEPCPEFRCEFASDDYVDGLIIADAIAYAAGRVARGDDADGIYQGVLDGMSAAVPTASQFAVTVG